MELRGLNGRSLPLTVHFTWTGFDEMAEISGDGHAELLDEGTIKIVFAYHNRDEAFLKAQKETSSTACEGLVTPTPRVMGKR